MARGPTAMVHLYHPSLVVRPLQEILVGRGEEFVALARQVLGQKIFAAELLKLSVEHHQV